VSDPQPSELLAENIATRAEVRALTTSTHESLRLTDLRQRTDEDPEYQQLKTYIYTIVTHHSIVTFLTSVEGTGMYAIS